MRKSKWQPVTFADVKVGDKVKSVSPCGTTRVGVVGAIDAGLVLDAEDDFLGRDWFTLYRRAPKPAKFVPLDVPEVGQWIEATLRDGRVVSGEVESVTDYVRFVPGAGCAWHVYIAGQNELLFIDGHAEAMPTDSDITSWRPTTPPAPPEPTGFGYVGYTNNGDEWQVNRYTVSGEVLYERVRLRDGRIEPDQSWTHIIQFGTFTAVSR